MTRFSQTLALASLISLAGINSSQADGIYGPKGVANAGNPLFGTCKTPDTAGIRETFIIGHDADCPAVCADGDKPNPARSTVHYGS